MSLPKPKKESRRAYLRRTAAKQGWFDGYHGAECRPPAKLVYNPSGDGERYNPVPFDQEAAYLDAYDQGKYAPRGAVNPYLEAGK